MLFKSKQNRSKCASLFSLMLSVGLPVVFLAGCSSSSQTSAAAPPSIASLNSEAKVTQSQIFNGIPLGTVIKPIPGFFNTNLTKKQISNGEGISSMTVLQVVAGSSPIVFRAPIGTSGQYYEVDVEARFCANGVGYSDWVFGFLGLAAFGSGGSFHPMPGVWKHSTIIPGTWLPGVRAIGAGQCVTGVSYFLVPATWFEESTAHSFAPYFTSVEYPNSIQSGYSYNYVFHYRI